MSTEHNYFTLPIRTVRDVILRVALQEDKTYELSVCDLGNHVKERRCGLSRTQVLLYYAAMGVLPYVSKDRIAYLLKRASQLCEQIEDGSFPRVYGCYFQIFFNTTGTWDLEFEPGMGTTVARMGFTTFDDACNALMGILQMLEPDKYYKRPYLQRYVAEISEVGGAEVKENPFVK